MDASSRPWRLLVADLDGTLVTGSVAAHLDRWIGHESTIAELQGELRDGQVTNAQVADAYAPLYRDVSRAGAAAALADIACLTGIPEGVNLLAERGIEAVIATVGWSFGADSLAGVWGFAGARGVDLEVDPTTDRFTGRVQRHFEPAEKVDFAAEFCAQNGTTLDAVVAVGDGSSDLPLFDAVGYSVALNASPDARAAASVAVDSRNFLDALKAVPGLLDIP